MTGTGPTDEYHRPDHFVYRGGRVWVVVGKRAPSDDRYIVGVYASETLADFQRSRWLQKHPEGVCVVEAYSVTR